MKYTKKVENKECPYRDTIIIVGSGKPIYWCALSRDKKQCIFKGHSHDAGECSYYLFPKDHPPYACPKCGKDIADPEKGHIGILTVLCEECAFSYYEEEIIKRD